MAVQLVSFQNGRMVVEPEGRAYLSMIGNQRPGVISVMGEVRQGKSTLCGLLIDRDDVFERSNGSNSKTEGLWISCASPPPISDATTAILDWNLGNVQPAPMLVVDTQGSNGVGQENSRDFHIYAISVLISSVCVYNTKGCMSNSFISGLSVAGQIAASIVDCDTTSTQSKLPVSRLICVLRDFGDLRLQDAHGADLDPRAYMEDVIDRSDGAELIRSLHSDRYCVTVPRPTDPSSGVFQEEFMSQVHSIKALCHEAPKKLTGTELLALLDHYVSCYNSGGLPSFKGGSLQPLVLLCTLRWLVGHVKMFDSSCV